MFRDTVNQLGKLKGGSKKKDAPHAALIEQLYLQVDDLENIYMKDIEATYTLVENIQHQISVKDSILDKSALPNKPDFDNEGYDVDNEMSVGDMDLDRLEVEEEKNHKYLAKDDLGFTSSKLQRSKDKGNKIKKFDYNVDKIEEEPVKKLIDEEAKEVKKVEVIKVTQKVNMLACMFTIS
jgi:hypothetical protein